jgi:DnaK suppressor protein
VPPQVQAPKLTRAQILEFKAMIESQRIALQEILSRLGQSDMESGSQDKPNRFGNHMADVASDSQLFETQLVQSGMEMDRLRQIDDALERLSSRRYGICERCGANIRYERLRAKPFARYCIVCREHFERESMRRNR